MDAPLDKRETRSYNHAILERRSEQHMFNVRFDSMMMGMMRMMSMCMMMCAKNCSLAS